MTTLCSRRSRPRVIILCTSFLWLIQLFVHPNTVVGQTQRDGTTRPWLAGRHDLDSLATAAEQEATDASRPAADRARSASAASSIRSRLQDGDFRVGDRLVLSVRGEAALTDTFTVRDGLVLKLPTVPDVSLKGVLRSEVQERVAQRVSEYYRDREVRVTTLVRIGVLGLVTRPGYYQLAIDSPVSDALMAAGGPTAMAAPDRAVVRHGGLTLWNEDQLREMLAAGATLAQLGIHSGDDILVQERGKRDWSTLAQVSAAVSGLVVSILYIVRR